jgi:hypothetical protein
VKLPYNQLRCVKRRGHCSVLLSILLALFVGQPTSGTQERTTRRGKSVVGQDRLPGLPGKSLMATDVLSGNPAPSRLSEIGRGIGIIFSPDLSVPTNREFYEKLGFAYFEDGDWRNIIRQIRVYNQKRPDNPLNVLIIESHGTNGNGLKLQEGHDGRAGRSYISIGALQEQLDATGVRLCIITACNAGRLFRPAIYRTLNTRTRDPLFLAATLGIVNASSGYDPARSVVSVLYPAKSALETTNEGDVSELAPLTRRLLEIDVEGSPRPPSKGKGEMQFVISDILAQLLMGDKRLLLKQGGYVTARSSENFTNKESEELFQSFLSFLDEIALRQYKMAGGKDDSAIISAPPNSR